MATKAPSMSFLLSPPRSLASKKSLRSQSNKAIIDVTKPPDAEAGEEKTMEGYLWVRIHVRRRRYCILQGRTLLVYNNKEESLTPQGHPSSAVKKKIVVVGVKDAIELDKTVRSVIIGGTSGNGALENALVISTQKSKLIAVEAETYTEKQRWHHAMSCLNFASASSEKSMFLSMLQDASMFDAHMAVTLLHRYRDNPMATELVIDRLAEYAEHHIDDVEFYIQQIMHLVVNLDMTKTDKLVNLLLSICKAKTYVEHLGNCIHLALQLFWLLEAKIQDNDLKTYNLCAMLLMSIEAKVVNQQFELPAASASADAITKQLMQIPGMKERLVEMKKVSSFHAGGSIGASPTDSKTAIVRPEEPTSATAPASITTGEAVPPLENTSARDDAMIQRELLMQWMEKERQKRYRYFHDQRDFVKALSDISERMRLVDPPQERKKHLPAELEALKVPQMAYIPLGRVSDPYSRITRVLKDEGTVFSTHSRAPCLLCFEVVNDYVNAAGHRASFSRAKAPTNSSSLRRSSTMGCSRGSMSITSSVASIVDEEVEISGYIKKFSIKGKFLSIDDKYDGEVEDDDGDSDGEADNGPDPQAADNDAALEILEQQLGISVLPLDHDDSMLSIVNAVSSSSIGSQGSNSGSSGAPSQITEDECNLIRRRSKASYDFSLAKLMSEGGAFGESWKDKKERIRATSPYGNVPGWNVISLISKSNDDIRQEVFAMQLITKFQDIFGESNLPLWLKPYRIMSTGKTCGLIETITDAQSLDALKKKEGYQSLRVHFERTYGNGDTNSKQFKAAQRNFLHSLAAYSVVCYLLQIKDRHNGNILLNTEGHLVHIDFGFMLGIAPGGNWSFETAPFKLTKEMVEVLGGISSKLFGEFVQLFAMGLIAAQRNAEKIITLVEIMMRNSTFPCFQGRDVSKDLQKLRDRFLLHHSTEQIVKASMKMVATSYKNKWTKRYDQFQKITNGIVP